MKNIAKLTCTYKNTIVPELELSLDSKDVKKELHKVQQYHYLNKKADGGYRYECSCKNKPVLHVVRTGNNYFLRDKESNLHSVECPLRILVYAKDKDGKKIGLTKKMLTMPTLANENINITEISLEPKKYRKVSSIDRKSTFNGMMATTIDFACSIYNSRPERSVENFFKVLKKQMFEMVFENTTLCDYQKKVNDETNKKLYFDNVIIDDIVIYNQKPWIKKSYSLNDDNLIELKYSSDIYKINDGVVQGVRGDILYKALQILRIHKNYIKGPYLVSFIKTKRKAQKYYDTPLINICPIMLFADYIFPVESNLERYSMYKVLQILDVKLFKPFSLDKDIYWNQLTVFLSDYEEELEDIKQAYSVNKIPIRPDLFMIDEGNVFVVEITGMMEDEDYKYRIKEKEDKFYKYLNKVTYIRASKAEDLVNIPILESSHGL